MLDAGFIHALADQQIRQPDFTDEHKRPPWLALAPTSPGQDIAAAFVYGSVAKATDAASDIDLMLVSDSLSYGEVFGALERAAKQLGRQVNPTVYTAAEFAKRTRAENAFVTRERRRQ